MWILIAEMLLALGVIIFIMWWTMRARVDHPVQKPEEQSIAKKPETRIADNKEDDSDD